MMEYVGFYKLLEHDLVYKCQTVVRLDPRNFMVQDFQGTVPLQLQQKRSEISFEVQILKIMKIFYLILTKRLCRNLACVNS